MRIGVVAPSSVVGQVELAWGVEHLKRAVEGLEIEVVVHPQARAKAGFFAGSDELRAEAFLEFAYSGEIDWIWCARGGFGANRLLPRFEQASVARGVVPPRKTLLGFSDVTALHAFVDARWGWNTVHAPMPGSKWFRLIPRARLRKWVAALAGRNWREVSAPCKLKQLAGPKLMRELLAPLRGGNLTVWNALSGTANAPSGSGAILVFEDLAEVASRLDRSLHQLEQSGAFRGVQAIVLGEFLDCADGSPKFLDPKFLKRPPKSEADLRRLLERPKPKELHEARTRLSDAAVRKATFGELGDRLQIPVFQGLPMGHGAKNEPLMLGANAGLRYRLEPDGRFGVSP